MGKQEMVAWMPQDDMKIHELHSALGPRWSAIASRFPGRTVSSIRNRFLRLQSGEKLRAAGHITKNRCQRCGLPKRGHICQVKLNESLEVSTTAEGPSFAALLTPDDGRDDELPLAHAEAVVSGQDAPPPRALLYTHLAAPALTPPPFWLLPPSAPLDTTRTPTPCEGEDAAAGEATACDAQHAQHVAVGGAEATGGLLVVDVAHIVEDDGNSPSTPAAA